MRRAARPRLARGRTMPREGSLSAAVATDLRTGRAACFRGGGGSAGSGLARSGAGGRVTSNQRRPGPSAKGSAIARAHALGGRSERREEAVFRARRGLPRDRVRRETRRGGGRASRRRAARAAPPNISRRIAKSATRTARRRSVRGGTGRRRTLAFARGRPAARPAVAEATAEAAVMAADIGLETPVCLKAPRGTKSMAIRYVREVDIS